MFFKQSSVQLMHNAEGGLKKSMKRITFNFQIRTLLFKMSAYDILYVHVCAVRLPHSEHMLRVVFHPMHHLKPFKR